VFYDENANGIADPNETMRLPGVTVVIGSASAQTTAGGRVTVSSVLPGAQAASLRSDTLPVYFTAGASVAVTVPQPAGSEIAVPATLAIGSGNRPRVYMAFGDSITYGDGSNDRSGYRNYLSANLASYWGSSHNVPNEGVPGTRSIKGESRMTTSLRRVRPAYTLILYGTNDWNDNACRVAFPCYTIDALRSMVLQCRDGGSFPVLGTIPPVNPAYTDRQPTERNDWVKRMNDEIRVMAKQQQVPVADIYDAFMKKGDLPSLFSDDIHPNETGYTLMAQVWLRAITQPLGASTSRRGLPTLFAFPGPFQ
jgi:lysophospholipase L1-like esterase